jgi:DNA polymerase I-like protein with 3'-5' exonuclease and polymerase domains
MIYFIGNTLIDYEEEEIKSSSVDDCLEYLRGHQVIGLDIETSRKFDRHKYVSKVYKPGLDPYLSRICMVQFSAGNRDYVIDARVINLEPFREILESQNYLKVIHNAQFEGLHFLHYGMRIVNIWDTMLAEKVLYNGLFIKYSLAALANRYLNIKDISDNSLFDNTISAEFTRLIRFHSDEEAMQLIESSYLDKSTRMQFVNWGDKPFTIKQIKYGVEDSRMVLDIYGIQRRGRLTTTGLYKPNFDIRFESNFTQVLANITYHGFNIDVERWLETYEKNKKRAERRLEILNTYVEENHPEFTGTIDLFNYKAHCLIQWSSSKQVLPLFKKYDLALRVKSKSTNRLEWTVGATHLLDELPAKLKGAYFKQKDVPITDADTLCLAYLLYKRSEQLVTTFGKDWLKYIHPITKKVHSRFNQYMITNRLSSTSPNIQQIPATKDFRDCFIAPKGKKWLSCDYAQQEIRVAAEVHNNQKMKDFFLVPNAFDSDYHSFAATNIQRIMREDPHYMVPPKSSPDFTNEHSKERGHSKTISFLLQFGGSPFTLAKRLGITEEEAEELYNAYFGGFEGLDRSFHKRKKFILEKGYSVISSSPKKPIDKRYFFPYFERMKELKKQAYRLTSYHEGQRIPPEEKLRLRTETEWSKIWKEYMSYKGKAERRGLNTPVQGLSSTMTKIAMTILYNRILEEDLDLQMVIPVHDELNCIGLEEHAPIIEEAMKRAGTYLCSDVPMDADCEVASCWVH